MNVMRAWASCSRSVTFVSQDFSDRAKLDEVLVTSKRIPMKPCRWMSSIGPSMLQQNGGTAFERRPRAQVDRHGRVEIFASGLQLSIGRLTRSTARTAPDAAAARDVRAAVDPALATPRPRPR